LTTVELALIDMESRIDRHHQFLYVHLPDCTFVYDKAASGVEGQPVWFCLSSNGEYRARNFVRVYEKWIFGDPTASQTGYTVENLSSHFGEKVSWQFNTMVVYNESRGAIVHELELVTLGGQIEFGKNPVVSTQWSSDGRVWSQPRNTPLGAFGDRNRRIRWFKQGRFRDKRMQRFLGTSEAHATFVRLEARIEGLAW
jgi:hypothetical protein